MSLEVRVDEGLCLGSQRCTYLAPAVFDLNGGGQAELVDAAALPEDQLIEIARQCPNFAIIVVRDGEVVVGED
jgi:ferredoxin